MSDFENCGSWVVKRSLKVESFMRKVQFNDDGFGFPRYYEPCVLDLRRNVAFRNAIVTENALAFTQNMPKSVILSLDFSDILNIETVADRHTLVKGGKNMTCICHHVRVHYRPRKLDGGENAKIIEADNYLEKSSASSSKSKSISSDFPTNSDTESTSVSDFSRQSSSLSCPRIPLSIFQMYEPAIIFNNTPGGGPSPPRLISSSDESSSRVTYESSETSSSTSSSPSKVERRRGQLKPSKGGNNKDFLETRPNSTLSWTPDEDADYNDNTLGTRRRSRSVDISQLAKLRQKFFGKGGNNAKIVEEFANENLEKLDFYLYLPNSLLLNELFLFWERHKLKSMMKDDGETSGQSFSLRDAKKAALKLNRLDFGNGRNGNSFHHVLPKLAILHKAFGKYRHLPRIFWKDWSSIMTLYNLLERCLENDRRDSDDDFFLDRCYSGAIIFDIFRLLFESAGPSWFLKDESQPNLEISEENEKTNNIQTLSTSLVHIILGRSSISPSERNLDVVLNPRKFSEGRWQHLPDSKAIKALATVHNSAVALLHEILCIIHFSSKDKERAKFMDGLKTIPLEHHLKLSMTQVVHLLWGCRGQMQMTQAVLLYRHIYSVQTLLSCNPALLEQTLQQNFSEEFRYFIRRESAKEKIPDRYPLKPKLLLMFKQLREQTIQE